MYPKIKLTKMLPLTTTLLTISCGLSDPMIVVPLNILPLPTANHKGGNFGVTGS